MTRRVADDVLGKITRQVGDLLRRLTGGSADPDRVRFGLRIAAENPPAEARNENLNRGRYLLESRWSFDCFHRELATFSLEKCDSPYGFEDFFNTAITDEQKKELLGMLKRIHNAQVPTHGGHKMFRLYQILDYTWFGYSEGSGLDGTLERSDVMLHYNLKPIMDFADDGTPIRYNISGEVIDLTDHKGAEAQVQAIVAHATSPGEATLLLRQKRYNPAAEVFSVQERSDCWEVLILMPAPRTIRCEPPKGYDGLLGTVDDGITTASLVQGLTQLVESKRKPKQ